MSWVSAVLAFIQLLDTTIVWLRENALIKQGEEQAIAKATAAILVKTNYAKQVMADMTKLDEKQVDDVLKELGAS